MAERPVVLCSVMLGTSGAVVSFYLLHDDGRSLLACDGPIVKAQANTRLQQASHVLDAVQRLEQQTAEACKNAESAARTQGHADGYEDGRKAFAQAIAELTRQTQAHHAEQEEQIATLALAALRRIIDDLGDEALMTAIARRAVAAALPATEILVQISPALAPTVADALGTSADMAGVTVMADRDLAAHQCRVTTRDGRIIADLDHQIAAIGQRWRSAHVD